MSVITSPEWISLAQAAEIKSVSVKTIRRMVARSEVRAERFGPRLIRIDTSSLNGKPLGGGAE